MKSMESIFPFKCKNCGCKIIRTISSSFKNEMKIANTKNLTSPNQCNEVNNKEHLFWSIANLWGFILLVRYNNYPGQTVKIYFYFGLTCPECKKTTINKYDYDKCKSDYDYLISQVFPEGCELTPFSISILIEEGIIRPPKNIKGIYNNPRIEQLIPPLSIPLSLLPGVAPFIINAEDIPELLKIENNNGNGYKVFPRIVGENSIYKKLDELLAILYTSDGTIHKYTEKSLKILVEQFRNNMSSQAYHEKYNCPKEGGCADLIIDDMSFDKYSKLRPKEHQKQIDKDILHNVIPKLHKAYRRKRNKIDFEIIYKNDFLNPFFKKLYRATPPDKRYVEEKKMAIAEAERLIRVFSKSSKSELRKSIIAKKIRKRKFNKKFGQRTIENWISDVVPPIKKGPGPNRKKKPTSRK